MTSMLTKPARDVIIMLMMKNKKDRIGEALSFSILFLFLLLLSWNILLLKRNRGDTFPVSTSLQIEVRVFQFGHVLLH